MLKSKRIAATLLGFVMPSSTAFAADYYWNPLTPSGTWSSSANWSVGAPGAYNQTWSDNNAAFFSGANQILIPGSFVSPASMNFTADGIQINDGFGDVRLVSSVPISVSGTNTATINESLTSIGAGSVMVKQGTGTLVVSGSNGITTVNVDAGTLRLGGNGAIGPTTNSASLIVNGTLDLGGFSATRGGLTGNGLITNSGVQTSTLTLGVSAGTSTFGGVIQNGTSQVNLIKGQSSTQILSGANTFTGTTTVNLGTLTAANTTAIGTSALVINGGNFSTSLASVNAGGVTIAGGTLTLNAGNGGVLALTAGSNFNMTSGTWALQLAGGTDQVTGTGTFSLTGGTLDLGDGAIDYAESYTLFSGFSAGTVSGMNITNYSSSYVASLGNDGVLSFTPVPEPGVMVIGALVPLTFLRRRRVR